LNPVAHAHAGAGHKRQTPGQGRCAGRQSAAGAVVQRDNPVAPDWQKLVRL